MLRPVVAGWVNSPTAASEQFSLLNQGLADRPLSANRYGRFGSDLVVQPYSDLTPLSDEIQILELQGASSVVALCDRPFVATSPALLG